MKNIYSIKQAIANIVHEYRVLLGNHYTPMSLRAFSDALSETLSAVDASISHQTIKNWEDERFTPSKILIHQILQLAPNGWQKDFALDVLGILQMDKYEPVTIIGKEAKQKYIGRPKVKITIKRRQPSPTPYSTRTFTSV